MRFRRLALYADITTALANIVKYNQFDRLVPIEQAIVSSLTILDVCLIHYVLDNLDVHNVTITNFVDIELLRQNQTLTEQPFSSCVGCG